MDEQTYTPDEARKLLRLWAERRIEINPPDGYSDPLHGVRQLVTQVLDDSEPTTTDEYPGFLPRTVGELWDATTQIVENVGDVDRRPRLSAWALEQVWEHVANKLNQQATRRVRFTADAPDAPGRDWPIQRF